MRYTVIFNHIYTIISKKKMVKQFSFKFSFTLYFDLLISKFRLHFIKEFLYSYVKTSISNYFDNVKEY